MKLRHAAVDSKQVSGIAAEGIKLAVQRVPASNTDSRRRDRGLAMRKQTHVIEH